MLENDDNSKWEAYLGSQALAPVPMHVASAIIKPIDKGKLKARALETVEQQASEQINRLRKQAELILAQVREIEQKVAVSKQIYLADMGFEPVIGKIYHLYEQDKGRFLSMVAPNEWGRTKRAFVFVASVKLNADKTWDVLAVNHESNHSS